MIYGKPGEWTDRLATIKDANGVEIKKVFMCDTETGFVQRIDCDPVTGMARLDETRSHILTIEETRPAPLSVVFTE